MFHVKHLTESSKFPAKVAKSNRQQVEICLYQEESKLILINCGVVIRYGIESRSKADIHNSFEILTCDCESTEQLQVKIEDKR